MTTSLANRPPESQVRRFFTSAPGRFLCRALLLVVFLAVWQMASGRWINAYFVSTPAEVGAYILQWSLSRTLWVQLGSTVVTVASGYGIGAIAGIGFGLALGRLPALYNALAPFLTAFYAVPKIAFVPLLIIIFGIGFASKIVLVALVVVFILLYSTRDGVRDVDPDTIAAMQLLGASQNEIFLKVLIPATLPWIATGLRIALPNALTTAVLGELIASNNGIGYLIASYSGEFNTAGVFAAVTILLVCSIIVSELSNRLLASRSQP